MASAFSRASRTKFGSQATPQHQENDVEMFKKFYIDEKFYKSLSYKKLFAPKSTIVHKSSYLEVNFDYIFDSNPNKKVLRISVSVMNVSEGNLRNVKMEIK